MLSKQTNDVEAVDVDKIMTMLLVVLLLLLTMLRIWLEKKNSPQIQNTKLEASISFKCAETTNKLQQKIWGPQGFTCLQHGNNQDGSGGT